MYKRGENWYSNFRYAGKRYNVNLGEFDTKIEAIIAENKFRKEVAQGKHQQPGGGGDGALFRDALSKYLDAQSAFIQPRTLVRYKDHAKHLLGFFGQVRVTSLQSDEKLLKQYIAKRKKEITAQQAAKGRALEEMTFTTINRELALIRALFNTLSLTGEATKKPTRFVTFFKEAPKERILSDEEYTAIMNAVDLCDCRYDHLKPIMRTLLATGMRLGEVLAMEKSWVRLGERLIIVPRASQKRKNKDKRVPMNSEVLQIVKDRLAMNIGAKYLFNNPRTGTRFYSIDKAWNTVLKDAGLDGRPGIDKLRLHDLRHTAATRLARAGVNVKFIQQYLGHAKVETTARYIHATDDDLLIASEKLAYNEPEVATGLRQHISVLKYGGKTQ